MYGPYLFDERTVISISYLNMLREFFIPQLQENPDLVQRALFKQDGAPAHFARIVKVFFNQTLLECWIGRGGPHHPVVL